MNVGDHVGDRPQHVRANRQCLRDVMAAVSGREVHAVFMQQVHGCAVLDVTPAVGDGMPCDACTTDQVGVACTVMVADCLPVLIAHRSGAVVAAAHAGWRGLAGSQGLGVLESTWQAYAAKLGVPADAALAAETQVWLGPCIGPSAFEVGGEVRQAFVQVLPQAQDCFAACAAGSNQWLANLPELARQRLQRLGIHAIFGNDGSDAWCTVLQRERFFSHRRDAAVLGATGRMAVCIWKV